MSLLENKNESANVKCPRCRSYKYSSQFLNDKGRLLKSCSDCRKRANAYRQKIKCMHGKQKSRCSDCGGSGICVHKKRKCRCVECDGSSICEHGKEKAQCVTCDGSGICKHKKQKAHCKMCSDPVEITMKNWIHHSRQKDKKYNRYDPDNFIDMCFARVLVEEYPNCYHCEIKMQYVIFQDDLATIERLNNSVGHIKSNCVLACMKCNKMKLSNATTI